ncbi:sigma factor-like helix-turn-helix DNA-binding protein [Sorangium sp. So ce381]|uniref:sigma factor-like helix-turn-helix DNA-binding protein n=1 Tax=Sorangium sp. So ce381 TaxID=3133307 RepID=UPI003F5AEBA9
MDTEDRRRAIEIVRGAYDTLGEEERRLYALRYVEGLPMHAVASGLGVSLSTARRRHDALLDRMAAALLEGGVTEMPPRE